MKIIDSKSLGQAILERGKPRKRFLAYVDVIMTWIQKKMERNKNA